MSANNIKDEYTPRLLTVYRDEVVPVMKETFGFDNALSVPRLLKIVINMGVGVGISDPKITEKCAEELSIIAGQKAKICKSKKNISNFKLKQGVPVGCCVTLRKARMFEFLDRFISIASPRIRDFRGFSPRGFDGRGNYSFGLTEQNMFAELEMDKVSRTQGMNITIHTSASNDEEGKKLLTLMGFPFRR